MCKETAGLRKVFKWISFDFQILNRIAASAFEGSNLTLLSQWRGPSV